LEFVRGKKLVTIFKFRLKKENCNVFIDVCKVNELDLRLAMALVDASIGAREGGRREANRVRRAVAVPRLCINRVERGGGE
jgi:hypothetical protein